MAPMDSQYVAKRPRGFTGTQLAQRGSRPGMIAPWDQPSRVYGVSSGSMASGGSALGIPLQFSTMVYIMGIFAGGTLVASGATPALSGLDGFTLQISRQTGDKLNNIPLIGSALCGTPMQPMYLPTPFQVEAGGTLSHDFVNLSGQTFTVYVSYICTENRI